MSDMDYDQELMAVIVEHRKKVRNVAFAEVLAKLNRQLDKNKFRAKRGRDQQRSYFGAKAETYNEIKQWLKSQMEDS